MDETASNIEYLIKIKKPIKLLNDDVEHLKEHSQLMANSVTSISEKYKISIELS